MAYGDVSLGGLDPELLQQIYGYIQPSPARDMFARNPDAMGGMSQMLDRISTPPVADGGDGIQTLPSRVFENQDDGLSRAFQITQGVLSAPFRLLGAGVQGLQQALGAPGYYKRQAREFANEAVDRQALLDQSLSWEDKLALGYPPEQIAALRKAYTDRQTSGDERAFGVDVSAALNPPVRQTGVLEWLTGDAQRERAEQAGRVRAYQQALLMKQEAAKLRASEAAVRASDANAYADTQRGVGYQMDNDLQSQYGDALERMKLEQGRLGLDLTRAQIGNIGADNARAASAEERARRAEARAEEDALLDRRIGRENLRGMKLTNREKLLKLRGGDSMDPDVPAWLKSYNAANTPEEKEATLDFLGIPKKQEEQTWSQWWKGEKPPVTPDVTAMKGRAQERASGGVSSSPETHPRFKEYVERVKRKRANLSEGEAIALAKQTFPSWLANGAPQD